MTIIQFPKRPVPQPAVAAPQSGEWRQVWMTPAWSRHIRATFLPGVIPVPSAAFPRYE